MRNWTPCDFAGQEYEYPLEEREKKKEEKRKKEVLIGSTVPGLRRVHVFNASCICSSDFNVSTSRSPRKFRLMFVLTRSHTLLARTLVAIMTNVTRRAGKHSGPIRQHRIRRTGAI